MDQEVPLPMARVGINFTVAWKILGIHIQWAIIPGQDIRKNCVLSLRGPWRVLGVCWKITWTIITMRLYVRVFTCVC